MTARTILLRELEWVCKSCSRLFALARPADLDFRPRENMRSLRELGHHLAQIPFVDTALMRSLPEAEVHAEEDRLTALAEEAGLPAGWRDVIREGSTELTRFLDAMTMAEFEGGSGTAYFGRTQTYPLWLLETVTHLYHHRSQFFTYMKLLGYDVSTKNLYD